MSHTIVHNLLKFHQHSLAELEFLLTIQLREGVILTPSTVFWHESHPNIAQNLASSSSAC